MTIVLRNQLEASERSAEELEIELHRAHRRAMICFDVEDLARNLVGLFADLNRDVDRWREKVATASGADAAELAAFGTEWHSLYVRLAGIYGKAASLIRTMETWNFEVSGKSEFLSTWRTLRGVAQFSPDDVARAAEQAARGEVRPLGEVADELCGSSHG